MAYHGLAGRLSKLSRSIIIRSDMGLREKIEFVV